MLSSEPIHEELIEATVVGDEYVAADLVPEIEPSKPRLKRFFGWLSTWLIVKPFQLASLIVILAVVSSIPILQVIALGYLLEVSRRIAQTGKFREGLFLMEQAGTIGLAAGALFLFSLPIRLLSYSAFSAELINPASNQPVVLRSIGSLLVVLVAIHIGWVWFRGNARWWSYLRPRPIEFAKQIWLPATWIEARDRLWSFAESLQIGSLFWLGARAMVGTLIWLTIPSLILIGTIENGTSGLAGLVGFIGLVLMAVVLLYLPYLQIRFATEDRFGAMFEIAPIRQLFRCSPTLFFIGLTATFLFSIPLYLLKVEATPQEVTWAPCIVMVAFVLPARLISGYAMARAMRKEPGQGLLHKMHRCSIRLLCIPIIAGYLLIVFLSGFTSWDGLETWFQQHSLLIPVPFRNGV